VVDYDDTILRDALHRLERRGFARLASGRGSRAPKYRHLLAEALPLAPDEHAILCVLLLRGPQTPGELKQRAERMHAFTGLDAVHDTLERLAARKLVARLERRPGQKEDRYTQLLEDREAPTDSDGRGLHSPPATAAARAEHGQTQPSGLDARWVGSDEWARDGGGTQSADRRGDAASDLRSSPSGEGIEAPAAMAPAGTVAALRGLLKRVAKLEREVVDLRMALKLRTSADTSEALGTRIEPGSTAPDQPSSDWP
jgi:uncharacterized protein YceH (UPF0502 family)